MKSSKLTPGLIDVLITIFSPLVAGVGVVWMVVTFILDSWLISWDI